MSRRRKTGPGGRGGPLPRRSPRQWIVRGLLALAVVVLGYVGVTFSLAQAVGRSDAARAHRLAPYDGRLTARLAATLTGAGASDADRRRGAALASLSLRQDPTAVAAASALGLVAQLRSDGAGARRLFRYAETLSRREPNAQLYAIEDTVARGNVKDALRHYDTLLRTKPAMGEMLFPVLTVASAEPAIQDEVVRTLAAQPAWSRAFISYAAINGTDPLSTARLLQRLRRVNVAIPQAAEAGVVGALLVKGTPDQAWRYYASMRPGVSRDRSRDPAFTAQWEAPTPLDWVAINEGSVTTNLARGWFDFSAPASVGGPLLQQTQLLPAGVYRLSGHSQDLDQPAETRPYWVLTCRDGRKVGQVEMPNSVQGGGIFGGIVRVPANCPVQALTLIARPSEAVGGLSGRLNRVQLTPAR